MNILTNKLASIEDESSDQRIGERGILHLDVDMITQDIFNLDVIAYALIFGIILKIVEIEDSFNGNISAKGSINETAKKSSAVSIIFIREEELENNISFKIIHDKTSLLLYTFFSTIFFFKMKKNEIFYILIISHTLLIAYIHLFCRQIKKGHTLTILTLFIITCITTHI